MLNRYKIAFLSLAIMVAAPLFAVPVQAGDSVDPSKEITKGVKSAGGNQSNSNLGDGLTTVVNILLFVLGAIAVISIVIGGIRYAVSGGDASNIKAAKDTILYSVIGLVVALLAYAIVNFVVGAF